MFYFATSTPLFLPHTENIAVEGETDLELWLVVAGEVGLDGGHYDQKKGNFTKGKSASGNDRKEEVRNSKNMFCFSAIYVGTVTS